jgi:hypothetical protein
MRTAPEPYEERGERGERGGERGERCNICHWNRTERISSKINDKFKMENEK